MSSWTPFIQEISVFRATAAGRPSRSGLFDRPELVKSGHKAKALALASDSTIGYRHSIVKTQVTQSNSKSLWTIFLKNSEMIDIAKLT